MLICEKFQQQFIHYTHHKNNINVIWVQAVGTGQMPRLIKLIGYFYGKNYGI